jgi:DNA-binding CsgD family transcriptional regulator
MTIIEGADVVGIPGQNLTKDELTLLVHHADGTTPDCLADELGTSTSRIRQLERSLKDKLGANTKPHMVGRGFILGVLSPRALCLALAFAAAFGGIENDDMLRTRNNQTRVRVNTSSRIAQSARTKAGSGSA